MKSNPTKTVLVISVGFSVIYLISDYDPFLIASIVVGGLGILSNKIATWIEILWMKLAHVLGLIVPNILLSIVFYLFLFPIALLSRTGKKNALFLKNNQSTLFVDKDEAFEPSQFEKTW